MDISMLCEQFCEYCLSIRGQSKATIRRYKHVIGCFRRFTGIRELDQVTTDKLRDMFFHGRTVRKWSNSTFLVYHVSLLVFFRWCITQGYMHSNPVTDIEKPRLGKRLPNALSKQNAHRLLEVVYNYPFPYAPQRFFRCRSHAIFATLIYAGLRKQEVLNLKNTDVDLDNMVLFVRHGKGDKDRIVPICFSLATSLKRYNGERIKLKRTCPEFFVSSNRNMGYTDQGLKRLVKTIKGASGIYFSIHKLRHTFATLMLEGGCDIFSLSKMMGHSCIQTTTIYLSASAGLLKSQITKHPLNDFGKIT